MFVARFDTGRSRSLCCTAKQRVLCICTPTAPSLQVRSCGPSSTPTCLMQLTWKTSAFTVSSRSRKRCTSTGATWGYICGAAGDSGVRRGGDGGSSQGGARGWGANAPMSWRLCIAHNAVSNNGKASAGSTTGLFSSNPSGRQTNTTYPIPRSSPLPAGLGSA